MRKLRGKAEAGRALHFLSLAEAEERYGAAMVLTGIFLPLGLVMLAPVLVHIVLYHHYLDTTGTLFSYVLLALALLLAPLHRDASRGLFRVSMLPPPRGRVPE